MAFFIHYNLATKTLMKIAPFIIIILLSTFSCFAQTENISVLTSNSHNVFIKNAKISNNKKNILNVFHYDNNEIFKGLGVRTEAYTLGTFIEIPDTSLHEYEAQTIDFIRFGIENASIIIGAKLLVYENKLEETPVLEQNIEIENIVEGWNLIQLTTGYTINNASIFVGVEVETSAGGYTLTYDTDPSTFPEYSGHTMLNGEYFGTLTNEVAIDADYNVQAIITDGQGANYNDLAITDIKSLSNTCLFSANEVLKVSIVNYGEDSLYINSLDLHVSINDTVVTQQLTPTTLYPNITKIINLPPIDMSNMGVYNIIGSIDFKDAVKENNNYSTILQSGNAKLRIDMFTDIYPEETNWTLWDRNNHIVAQNTEFEAELFYSNEICIIDTNCYSLVLNDLNGDGILVNDTIENAIAVYYNDSTIWQVAGSVGFGYEFTKFGIASGCLNNDISLNSIDLPYYEAPNEITIKGSISNFGTQNITSFIVYYQIGDYISPQYLIDNIDIKTGESYIFSHPNPYNFSDNGTYPVMVFVSQPNNMPDEDTLNNMLEHNMVIHSDIVSKKQLIEHFTSSTNDACFSITPLIDEVLANKPDEYSLIRYQMNKPGSGDPYFIEETNKRVQFYNVSKIPSVFRNGIFDNDYSTENFDDYAQQKTIIELQANARFENTSIFIDVDASPIIDTDTSLLLYTAIVENATTGNIGTNGETEFFNVLLKMLPNGNGEKLPSISAGANYSLSYSFDMQSTFVEEMNDLSAVIFVQNNESKQILQSLTVPISILENINEPIINNQIGVFPNPFNATINITNAKHVSFLQIADICGKTILERKVTTPEFEISTNYLKEGVYLIKLFDSDKRNIKSKKIIKTN